MNLEQSLFDVMGATDDQSTALTRLREVGVVYETAFLNPADCDRLLRSINDQPWLNDLRRRVQHYGWRYDYSSRFVTADMRIGPLPDFIGDVAAKLCQRDWFHRMPDQVIVNEYNPGQGIAPHVDRECFGPAVATLSLGDAWPMQFRAPDSDSSHARQPEAATEKIEIVLDIGSILVLRDDARHRWTHGIAPRQSDGRGRNRRRRERRVSVTFRTVDSPVS